MFLATIIWITSTHKVSHFYLHEKKHFLFWWLPPSPSFLSAADLANIIRSCQETFGQSVLCLPLILSLEPSIHSWHGPLHRRQLIWFIWGLWYDQAKFRGEGVAITPHIALATQSSQSKRWPSKRSPSRAKQLQSKFLQCLSVCERYE